MNKLISAQIILASVLLISGNALAGKREHSCAALGRINAIEAVKSLVPNILQSTLIANLCSKHKSDTIGGSLKPSKGELKGLKTLICAGQKKDEKSLQSAHRKLKKIFSREQQKSLKRCIALEKKGLTLSPNLSGESSDVFQIDVSAQDESVAIQSPQISPEGAFECTGPLTDGIQNLNNQKQGLYLHCKRSLTVPQESGATIIMPTSKGNLSFQFAPQVINLPQEESIEFQYDFDRPREIEYVPAPLPEIPSCYVANAHDRIGRVLTCTVRERWQECNAEMERGNVVDCKAHFAANVQEGVREVHIIPEEGEYEKRLDGELRATVYRGFPGRGFVEGRIDYSINFQTPNPERRSSRMCDGLCPRHVCGNDPCNRSCSFVDQVLETTSRFGPESMFRIPGPGCEGPAQGSIMQTELDSKRSYALCEHRQAWGQTITGVFYAQVSKSYRITDMRTAHIVMRTSNSYREIWSMIDPGERWRAISRLEIPVTIQCMP